MNLASSFARASTPRLDQPAVYWGEAAYSYKRLFAQSQAVAVWLRDSFGVKPGDRVGIWLKNCPEFISALFGILSAGGVVVPINNFLKAQEVEYILADADIDVLISESGMRELLDQLAAARVGLRTVCIEDFPVPETVDAMSELETVRAREDLAVIIYTSGTTGRPKGAMLSHGNLLHNVESCRHVLKAVSFDRFVVLLPMFHSFMLTVGMLLPLLVGGSIVLVKSLHPPKNILHEIITHQATILPAIPQFYRTLAHAHAPALPLRLCVSGAAPLPLETLRQFNEAFSIPLIEGYGLSEASPVCSMNPVEGPQKPGSIGRPVLDVEMCVQDDAGRHLPPDEIGEICVRGGNVMLGYWKKPEETARTMREGWLLTGDVGYRDAENYFYITDRKKDMLLVNGINVYPREIEEIVYSFPGVKEAAVIGVPDARKGEHPLAFVSPNEGVTLDEKALLQHIRQNLADYKVPRHVVFLPSLPRNATGKILKTALREMHSRPSEA
jgi:long-chain acyl-CoA synthetase